MEGERKRKRAGKRTAVREADGVRKEQKSTEEEAAAAEVPTEEEVEEFFAILRRMKVAIKYFEKTGKGGSEESAAAAAEPEKDADGAEKTVEIGLLDLNAAAPEADSGL